MEFTKESLMELLGQISPNNYVQALLIVIVSVCLAKLFDVLISKVLLKWIEKTKIELDDKIIDIIHKPIFFTIIIFGLGLATEKLEFKEGVNFIVLSGLQTVVVFFWSVAVIQIMKVVLNLFSNDKSQFKFIQQSTLSLFNNLLVLVMTGLSIYIVFLIWNIDLTAWVASAGILGLAISFAAKDTLANLFSGVFILADAPYKLGDFIVLDTGERGEVINIGIRSTRLLTRSDVEIIVPNSIMGNTQITNEAGGPHEKFRVSLKIGVAYGSDIDKVHDVLLEVARQHTDVCKTPEPRVRFRNFGDSSLDHELLCWVERPVLRGKVLHMLNTDVYKRFIKEGIQIPFPQRDVHIKPASAKDDAAG
ncbi:MAG: mechanosensitive ion channel [Desulfobacterales bacterium]|nr:mechanosensitive ion channel [Desulfobacterales bacterium]